MGVKTQIDRIEKNLESLDKYVEIHTTFFKKLIEDLKVLGNATHVLMWFLDALIEQSGKNPICASIPKIASDLRLSPKTVRKHLKLLLKHQYIVPFPGQDLYAFAPQYLKPLNREM